MVKKVDQMIKDMIYKEEHILYPMNLEMLTEDDWMKVKKGGRNWVCIG